jgi:hypothetical protein
MVQSDEPSSTSRKLTLVSNEAPAFKMHFAVFGEGLLCPAGYAGGYAAL